MESKAKFLGHALHPILIVFPLGLLSTSIIFDGLYLWTGNGRWADIAFYMILSGVVGGVIAAIFGWIDWAAIPKGTRANRIGLMHGLGNVVVLALFAASWVMRQTEPTRPGMIAIGLSGLAVLLALGTGWLGGELVERLGIGVDPGAHPDSPSSLSGRPASEHDERGPASSASERIA